MGDRTFLGEFEHLVLAAAMRLDEAYGASLIREIESTGRLHTLGRLMTRQEMLRGLRTRLFLTQARDESPAIARLRRPHSVTVLLRTRRRMSAVSC